MFSEFKNNQIGIIDIKNESLMLINYNKQPFNNINNQFNYNNDIFSNIIFNKKVLLVIINSNVYISYMYLNESNTLNNYYQTKKSINSNVDQLEFETFSYDTLMQDYINSSNYNFLYNLKLLSKLNNKYISKISLGDNHIMFLSSSGVIYVVGNNSSGQLGLDSSYLLYNESNNNKSIYDVNISQPVMLSHLIKWKFIDIKSGKDFNLATAYVRENTMNNFNENFNSHLKSKKYNYCNVDYKKFKKQNNSNKNIHIVLWGNNSCGQLGANKEDLQLEDTLQDYELLNKKIESKFNKENFENKKGIIPFPVIFDIEKHYLNIKNNNNDLILYSKNIKIEQIDCGYNFTAILTNVGLFLLGDNSQVQISKTMHEKNIFRINFPCLIKTNNKNVISQIKCSKNCVLLKYCKNILFIN